MSHRQPLDFRENIGETGIRDFTAAVAQPARLATVSMFMRALTLCCRIFLTGFTGLTGLDLPENC